MELVIASRRVTGNLSRDMERILKVHFV